MTCEQEHVSTLSGIIACKGPGVKRTFVMPKKYNQYRTGDIDDSEDDNGSNYDDDGDGNGSDDEDGDEECAPSDSSDDAMLAVVVPAQERNKRNEAACSTRSATAPRRSKRTHRV